MGLATLNLSEAMELAVQTHRHGHLTEAETLYGFILQTAPHHPPALQGLGILLHQRGYSDQAARLMQAAVALEPINATYWNALGKTLQHLERYADAESAFRKAIALHPRFVEALCNLGNVLSHQGNLTQAVEYYCQAIVAEPKRNKSRAVLGIGYSALGRIEEATEVYRQWLLEEPENPTAAHLYAACSGEDIPTRAANRYIETTFDEFAGSFDEQLLEHLSYQGPTLIKAALAKISLSTSQPQGLDAGCGTGLCGAAMKPYVSHLTGVDLSSKMLALAQQQGVYDELKKVEITRYLIDQVKRFDVIVMADTLIYFGALEAVLAAAYQSLKDGGVFIFTVESATEPSSNQDYGLNTQGRYIHDHNYIYKTLTACHFADIEMTAQTLRMELAAPVQGAVVTARKPATSLLNLETH